MQSRTAEAGLTDMKSVKCLMNSIYRFVHLVTSCPSNNMAAQENYRNIAHLLKLLKSILDNVDNSKLPSDESLFKECEKLDIAVNEFREFLEYWSPKTSKTLRLLDREPLIRKIKDSSLEICHIICRLVASSSSSPSSINEVKQCMEEFKDLKPDTTLEHIETALESRKKGEIPCYEHLLPIIESFEFTSTHEFLNESIALEKERLKAENNKTRAKLDRINDVLDLISHIRNSILKLKSFKSINGVPIPDYFRCPLSLEPMLEPVIVASGQTYEKASIQTWLDHGLTICPKNRQPLSHKHLIPNHTVKALIENWREKNKTKKTNETADLEYRSCYRNGNMTSPEHSYTHSRSESASSALSSIDYLRVSSNQGSPSEFSGELTADCPVYSRTHSLPLETGAHNSITTNFHAEKLVDDLKNDSVELRTLAAAELRFLTKHSAENRLIVGNSGAIPPLISLLNSESKPMQEHAVTALLNLSISEKMKSIIAENGALEPIIHVLRTGNACAKENAAAALFSLSVLDEYRAKIGRSGAVKELVDLLKSGTLRGKKDATTALFNLSIFHENKARIVQAGAVKPLVELLEPEHEMVDKAVAVLANLCTVTEGCLAVVREGGLGLLVEVVEMGSQRGKENAASILLQICVNSSKHCRLVLQEGAVPPLVALSQSGTPRAKEKAQQLLSHFRSQREGSMVRKKS